MEPHFNCDEHSRSVLYYISSKYLYYWLKMTLRFIVTQRDGPQICFRGVVIAHDVPQIQMRSVELTHDVPQTKIRSVVPPHDAPKTKNPPQIINLRWFSSII